MKNQLFTIIITVFRASGSVFLRFIRFQRSPTCPLTPTVGLGHAFRQVEEMIASSILGVRGRAGARWNRMNLRNTDPLALKTVIMIVKS